MNVNRLLNSPARRKIAACLTLAGLALAPSSHAAPAEQPGTVILFDGGTLAGWQVIPFAGPGEVEVENGELIIGQGMELSGIVWTNHAQLPRSNYELSLEGKRVSGSDFFCGLTFPVKESFCSLILGGWGGAVVGLSSIDGDDASENETTQYRHFERERWHAIRLRVTDDRIIAWIDDDKIVDINIEGRRISLRPGEIERCAPLGLATWQTTGAFRNMRLQKLESAEK
jgi:hypothetical protein